MEARPDVLNHNTETVPRLYRQVRLGARYERSLDVLQHARRVRPQTPTKSGLMLGLGETTDEVLQVMRDLRAHEVGISDAGAVPAAFAEASADRALRDAGGVRRVPHRGERDGLRARGVGSAGAQLIPRVERGRRTLELLSKVKNS